jgi:type I restriction enzyme S subunit
MVNDFQSTVYGDFAADYESNRLADICNRKDGVQTGPFGSQLHQEDYVLEGTPIITVEHLDDNRILHSDVPCVSEKDCKRLCKYSLLKGDIVFSRVGSVDRRALVRDEENGWLFSGRCLRVRPNKEIIDPRYLSYFFGLPSFKEHIRAIAVGATMPSLNTKILSDVIIYYPPLPEQRAIAHILGTLDDKIELNRQMNETLEAMARAIFKSWFVDFDPVRAKAEGRDTGLPKEIADLFPDSFEETEMGEVPKGWHVSSIGDLAEVVGGSTPSTKEHAYWDYGTHYWATPKDLSSLSFPVLLSTERLITDAGLSEISSGLLPKGTVLLSSRAPIGYLAVTEVPVAINQGFIAMKPKKDVSNLFILLWASFAHEDILSRANGSTFLEISKSNFRPIPIATPTVDVMNAFDKQVRPLYEKIVEHEIQSHTLAELRDTLLPKLISGELRVAIREGSE